MTQEREGRPDDCHSLWIGPRLPPLAQACLMSFLRHGHRVALHCYEPVVDVPAGVEIRDAARILPKSAIIRHYQTNSPSLFSNYWRYKMMESLKGYWIDCDVYCLRPFDYESDPVFGWQQNDVINGAVLRLIPGSPFHRDAIKVFEDKRPEMPWFSKDQMRRAKLRSFFYRRHLLSVLPWGSTGPRAITYLARKHDEAKKALPVAAFYPLHYEDSGKLLRADFNLSDLVTEETRAVHLWNETLLRKDNPPEPGSFLDRIVKELEGGPPAMTLAA
ncbi:MAG: hypothetical protein AAFY02_08610 [Pseudomonadota bacterium]